jgi:lactate permease
VTFAAVQFTVSNFVGPELTDILSALTSIGAMLIVMKVWHPKTIFRLEGDIPVTTTRKSHTGGELFMAWLPYLLLVVFVLAWGEPHFKALLNTVTADQRARCTTSFSVSRP